MVVLPYSHSGSGFRDFFQECFETGNASCSAINRPINGMTSSGFLQVGAIARTVSQPSPIKPALFPSTSHSTRFSSPSDFQSSSAFHREANEGWHLLHEKPVTMANSKKRFQGDLANGSGEKFFGRAKLTQHSTYPWIWRRAALLF